MLNAKYCYCKASRNNDSKEANPASSNSDSKDMFLCLAKSFGKFSSIKARVLPSS